MRILGIMASVQTLRNSSMTRRVPTPGDLQGLRRSFVANTRRRRRKAATRRWLTPRMIAVVLLLLTAAQVAGAFGGSNDFSTGSVTAGCQLASVVDGNTIELVCPGQQRASYDVMGLQSPRILGAACLTEAWWGIRSRIALRAALWRSQALTFIPDPRGNVVLVFTDGQPLHRAITPAPRNPCT